MEITNARLILPDAIERGSLSIRNGRIQKVSKDAKPAAKSKGDRMNLRGGFLSPGFVDLHIHGALGRDTMEARLDALTSPIFSKAGPSLSLTTLSASQQDILTTLDAIAPIHNQSLVVASSACTWKARSSTRPVPVRKTPITAATHPPRSGDPF